MMLSEIFRKINDFEEINYCSHLDFFQINSKEIKKKKIYNIVIRITNRCNFNCVYCFNEKTYDYDLEKVDKFINSLYEKIRESNQKFQINFSGGEPFCNKNFIKYLRCFSNLKNCTMIIQTNASLIPFDQLKNLKNLTFFVSFPSINSKLFEKITQQNDYNQVIRNIKKINECFPISFNIVITKDNYDSLDEIIKFSKKEFDMKNIYLNISNLIIYNKFDNYEKLLIEYKKISKKITNFLVLSESLGIKSGITLSEGCGFPFCILEHDTRIIKSQIDKAEMQKDNKNNREIFYKDKRCNTCKFEEFCPGFQREYINFFGDKEIKPVK